MIAKCEHDLQNAIIQTIRDRGGVAIRVNSGSAIFKRNGSTQVIKGADKGTSDIVAIYRGFPLCIEVKFGEGRPSKEQLEFGKSVNRAGGIFMVVWDLESVEKELDDLDMDGSF